MFRFASILVHLASFMTAQLATAMAGDVCPPDGELSAAVPAVGQVHLDDMSDAGSQFIQVSTLATHGKKDSTVLQTSTNSSIHPAIVAYRATKLNTEGKSKAGASTLIEPLKCDIQWRPLQMMKDGDNGFAIKYLDLETGHYSDTGYYNYPWDFVDPPYADLNACDVNPFDDIIYCVLRSEGKSYIVRMDKYLIEFVAELPSSIWSSGGFASTGEFFVSMHGSELLIVPPIHELPSFPDEKRWAAKNMKSLKPSKPEGFWHTADAVIVMRNYTGFKGDEWFVSVYGPKLQMAAVKEGKVFKTFVKHISPSRWDNVYGAGWNFNGDVFFSINSGGGVWRVPLELVDLNDEDQIIQLEQVGISDPTDFNDGLCCHQMRNPFPKENQAELEKKEAEAKAADPEEPLETPVATPAPEPALAPAPAPEVVSTQAPVLAPAEPAPAEPVAVAAPPPESPAPAEPAPVVAAPLTPPPPNNWGPVGLFMLLLIPLFLCCMRQLQLDRSELLPPPFMYPSKPKAPQAPVLPPRAPASPRPPMMAPSAPRSQPTVISAPPSQPAVLSAPAPMTTAAPPPPVMSSPVMSSPVASSPPPFFSAPAPGPAPGPVTIQARPNQNVTEIDKVNMRGQVVERDFISGGQVVERDFIVGAAAQSPSSSLYQARPVQTVTEIDRVNTQGQVFERDFIVGAGAPAPVQTVTAAPVQTVTEIDKVMAGPAVTEIDRVNAAGQVVERDFIVGGAAQQVVARSAETVVSFPARP